MKLTKSKTNTTAKAFTKLHKAENGAVKKTAKKEKPAKDPNKPKRPPTAFLVFMEDFRKHYKNMCPDIKSVAAVSKAGGEKWKTLSESEKAPYIANADKRKTEYTDLMETYYYNKLTDESKSEVVDDINQEGIEVESAQRCKLRLERQQRTDERVAKALEEKKLCDYIAQREQAERNRLSDTLDADIKRWATGKEGNLRGLLSSLQCIIGTETGWDPITLKDIMIADAVKKAYRKATLCVHPDKLQQRGASIRQKYMCEKIFELLKDAWNKYSSDKR